MSTSGHYDANYGSFQTKLYAEIRREAFGEDIGQQSWITAAEQDAFIQRLNLSAGKTLLDVACGSGGPALRIAAKTGCTIAGIDVHEQALENARALAAERGLGQAARFQQADAREPLPFPDASFDAITCIDAINHLPDRSGVVRELARVLTPGGRLLYTDPVVVTGALSSTEVARRSSIGFFLFVPQGHNERAIADAGLTLLSHEDTTPHMTEIARRRGAARAARRAALIEIEGEATYQAQQHFFDVVAELGADGRLSRFVYVAMQM
jgi:2-polyprenyl-3-methyl-5-hydroxy-6-metoxy-1,4-benzoquinol methylase